jgi:hypothetical protein
MTTPAPLWLDPRFLLMVIMGGLGGVMGALHCHCEDLLLQSLAGTLGATLAVGLYAFTMPAVSYTKRPRRRP